MDMFHLSGVYDDGPFQVHIDVVRVPELREIKRSKDALTLGGGVTLNDAIRAMEVDQEEGFKYLNEVAAHWKKVCFILGMLAHLRGRRAFAFRLPTHLCATPAHWRGI